jgi:hypothetical protein
LNFIATANDVQVSNPYVISDGQFLYANDDVKVSDLHVIVNLALAGIDDAEPKVYSPANLITEEQSVAWSH